MESRSERHSIQAQLYPKSTKSHDLERSVWRTESRLVHERMLISIRTLAFYWDHYLGTNEKFYIFLIIIRFAFEIKPSPLS